MSLLVVQDIMASVQLQPAPAASASAAAPAPETPRRRSENGQAPQPGAATTASRPPAEASAKSSAGSQPGKHTAISPGSKSEGPRKKVIKAGMELDGLRTVFDAEAVFAACQIAADAVSMQESLAPVPVLSAGEQQQPASAPSGPTDSSGDLRRDSKPAESQQARQATRAATPQRKGGPSSKLSKYELQLSARLSDLQAEIRLSEMVCWGVHVQTVSAAYGPRCAVIERVSLSLNSAQLISLGAAVLTAHVPGILEEPTQENSPWLDFPKAEGAEDLGRALTGMILPPSTRLEPDLDRGHDYDDGLLESASLMNSIVTDLNGEDDGRTLSRQGTSLSSRWRDLADTASASDVGDPSPLKPAEFSGPLTSLVLPQRPFGNGLEGLPAAYKRAGLGFWAKERAPAEVGHSSNDLWSAVAVPPADTFLRDYRDSPIALSLRPGCL